MGADRNVFILGVVLFCLGVAAYARQIQLELRKAPVAREFRFCGYTLSDIGTKKKINVLPDSTMVVHGTVNAGVVGSSPTRAVKVVMYGFLGQVDQKKD